MKIILVFSIIIFCGTLYAQPPEHPDTIGWAGAKATLINAPILLPGAEPRILVPNREEFCFDMMLDVEMRYGGRLVDQGVFLNNTDGYIGFTTAVTGGGGPINIILPEVLDFNFMVFGYKGNAYRYFNKKNKRGEMEHYVSTGNTDMHKYQIADAMLSAPLARKNIMHSFIGGTIQAMAYKLDDQPTIWYLHGDRYPEFIHVVKTFTAFGVGTVKAREGSFILMRMESGSNSSTINAIDYNRVCFDPTDYHLQETEFIVKRRLELDRERDRIERHALSASSARTCRAERMEVVNFEREELQRQERNLDSMTRGNTYQNLTAQKAYMGLMDPLTTVQTGIRTERVSICEYSEALSHGSSESTAHKLACSSARLSRLLNLEIQMRALDREYATQPGVSYSRKSQLLLAEMRSNCE